MHGRFLPLMVAGWLLLTNLSQGVEPPPLLTTDDVLKHADKFVQLLSSGDLEGAANIAAPYSLHSQNQEEYKKKFVVGMAQINVNSSIIGDSISTNLVGAQVINDSVLRVCYLEKGSEGISYFSVVYYRPRDHWLVANVDWRSNSDMDKVLPEIPAFLWTDLKSKAP